MIVGMDFDGTIASCHVRHQQVLRVACGFSRQQSIAAWNMKRTGLTTQEALSRIGMNQADAAECAAEWVRLIENPLMLLLDSPIQRALHACRRIAADGHDLVLISARKSTWSLKNQIRSYGVDRLLAGVHVVDPFNARCEKAQVLESLGCAVYVGDTESDLSAAADAGVPFLAVASGMRSADFFRSVGHREVFPSALEAFEAFA